ncbi:hypothetical protein FOL47_005592 [Perkinsus chesapeaki]|uniref:Uncharacterized protein n=1 Tax=Perkinsus chesapeaki TaxID=330153 RepID=A0A7J6LWN7_PERCH|nr:hypothetical protein FOL47_005592 [Perkinsus chesapeaki]
MFGNTAAIWILGGFFQSLSTMEQSHGGGSSLSYGLSPANDECQALCGSNNMSDCGHFGSYCKSRGHSGRGVCQGFYYLPDNTTCFYNTHPTACPEDRPVFCGGNVTTTVCPTTSPGPTTTHTPGPTTTAPPGYEHPVGTYAGNTTNGTATYEMSALFPETKTIVQELNVTISGVNVVLSGISYTMWGPVIILNYTDIPAGRYALLEVSLIYFSEAETIEVSISVLKVKIVMHKKVA